MSKKNERYYKVHGVAGQQRRYPIDKNKLYAIDSRFIVQFEGLQGELCKCARVFDGFRLLTCIFVHVYFDVILKRSGQGPE